MTTLLPSSRFLAAVVLAPLLFVTSANAAPVQSPDEVCAPTDNPCVIDSEVEVSFDHPLDFGTRTVRLEGEGKLVGSMDIAAGDFVSEIRDTWMQVSPPAAFQKVRIEARRGCSLDPAFPCVSNANCGAGGKGTCSVGDGAIRLRGILSGVSPIVEITAVSDVEVRGRWHTGGTPAVPDANTLTITSREGDVRLSARISTDSGIDAGTGLTGRAGAIIVRAGNDIFVNRRIRSVGYSGGLRLEADGNIKVRASVHLQGGHDGAVRGGAFEATAAEGYVWLSERKSRRPIRINLSGGSLATNDGVIGGNGGNGEILGADDVFVDSRVLLRSDGWASDDPVHGGPGGGSWEIETDGITQFAGSIEARGLGLGSTGGSVDLTGSGGTGMSIDARIDVRGETGGAVRMFAQRDPIELLGLVDVRGVGAAGRGGSFHSRASDFVLFGRILNGGRQEGGSVSIEACDLEIFGLARIDGSLGDQAESAGSNSFEIRETMTMLEDSFLLGVPGSTNAIVYRNAAEPPQLSGHIEPGASLSVDPSLLPCLD